MIDKMVEKSIAEDRRLVIIYQKKQEITKRVIHPIALEGDRVKAYDYTRRGPRVFLLGNILAAELDDTIKH